MRNNHIDILSSSFCLLLSFSPQWLWLVLNRYQFFCTKKTTTWLVVDNKAMQFESKIITGNGRRQTSRESTYLRDLSTFAKSCATQMKVQTPGLILVEILSQEGSIVCVCVYDVCVVCVWCVCDVCVCVICVVCDVCGFVWCVWCVCVVCILCLSLKYWFRTTLYDHYIIWSVAVL